MKLFRELGLMASTFLVIGNIIGVGIFTTSGLIVEQLGTTSWVLLVWVLAGLISLIGAICYSILGRRYPHAGGEYAFLKPAFGSLPAFLSGWASLFIGFTAPIAASALALAHYSRSYLPLTWTENELALKGVALAALLLVTFFLSLGLKFGSHLHSVVTVANFLLSILFAVLVLREAPVNQNLLPLLNYPASVDLPSLASAFVLVMFAYSGWNAAAYIAEEIKNPRWNIPGALLLGTALVVTLYLLVNAAYFSAVPARQLAGEIAVAEITARAVFGPMGQNLVNILILFSILSSLTAMSIAGPRVYFAMARDRLFPAWLSEVHDEKKIPVKAIWFQSSIAALFVLVGTFSQILLYSGFILILFSTLTVAALYRMSRHRILPTLFIAFNLLVLVNAARFNPLETLAGLITVALGIPVYYYYRSRPGHSERAALADFEASPSVDGESQA